jgi:hemolysin III
MFAGGLMYTGGAIVLATRRPNPRPAVFGYHEIWHSLTIGASVCHYALIILIVLAAR